MGILSQVEIVFWPALADGKRADLEAMPAGYIDVALINGAIRTEENLEMVRLLREKSKLVVAYGACAHMGGVPSLANLSTREELIREVFGDGWRPGPPPGASQEDAPPELLPQALPLARVVEVDYTVPGCPPPAGLIGEFFSAFLSGEMPEQGHVFAKVKSLCEECPRTRGERVLKKIVRPHEIVPDPEVCLLDQGIICLGPVTRGGCGAACPKAGMPCTGCLGPTPKAGDMGLSMISALASLVRAGEEGEAAIPRENEILDRLVDPIGTLYKYGVPTLCSRRERAGVRGKSSPSPVPSHRGRGDEKGGAA